MRSTKIVYKVIRSILFTAVLTVAGLLAAVYVIVSVPAVQRAVKDRAQKELTGLLGGKVEIGRLDVYPFNELRLHEVSVYTPEGKRCISVSRLGAGISLWSLFSKGELVFTYAEVIALNARIEQSAPDGPLNIQFIINAFSRQDNKKSSDLNVRLHNVVIRKSNLSFHRSWIPETVSSGKIDFNHIDISDFRADVALPLISGDDISIDLRRLAFSERSGLDVRNLSLKVHLSPREISFSDFDLKVGESELNLTDTTIPIAGYGEIANSLRRGNIGLGLRISPLYSRDFSPFAPVISDLDFSGSMRCDVSGNLENLSLDSFSLADNAGDFSVSCAGRVSSLLHPRELSAEVDNLTLKTSSVFITSTMRAFTPVNGTLQRVFDGLGDVSLSASGGVNVAESRSSVLAELATSAGNILSDAHINWFPAGVEFHDMKLTTDLFNVGSVIADDRIGSLALDCAGTLKLVDKDIEGDLAIEMPFVDFNGHRFESINIAAEKTSEKLIGEVDIDDIYARLAADFDLMFKGDASVWKLECPGLRLAPAVLGVKGFAPDDFVAADIHLDIAGNTIDTLTGEAEVSDLKLTGSRNLTMGNLAVSADVSGHNRVYTVGSDFLNGSIEGDFSPILLTKLVRNLLSEALPVFFPPVACGELADQYAVFNFEISPSESLYSMLKTPFSPGTPVSINGRIDGESYSAALSIDAPYLIKGRNKLVKNTQLKLQLKDKTPATVQFSTLFPMKNDYASLSLGASVLDNAVVSDLAWQMAASPDNKGKIDLDFTLAKSSFGKSLDITAGVNSGGFSLNGAEWTVSPARIVYSGKKLEVNNLKISNGLQFVNIYGRSSDNPLDVLTARLEGIDLEYIFNILNINHVDFGGVATGSAVVLNLFSKEPVARTDGLFVRNLAYNGCVLGDAQLESHWDNRQKMVAINADIEATDNSAATVRGGVYVTRDSLAFDFNARRIDIEFLQPFMEAFTSKVRGKASGQLTLAGTFSDIDLVGKAHADTITMRVDYTNVDYSGSDSIYFFPGRIEIPHIRLYDRLGNNCMFKGVVTHNYLKDASFDFEMSDAKQLLVYDTDASFNPRWYGRVFADGAATLHGIPGLVTLNINMRTARNSEFTIVLDETQTAIDYAFLTFSDRRKEAELAQVEVEESFEDRFNKVAEPLVRERPDLFSLDLALDVNPSAEVVIVMDPKAGDKIKASGVGALQMHYDTDADDFDIFGKYTLNRGSYNFSLQDLILKNFQIEEGSSISFNGDPLAGILDITAAYRVNTNLTDLDASFASDPDLTRTSVPVDALLRVRGGFQTPELTFDLRLPTVTPEVERKVKSIISTEDMMNRQMIYLLALNRFYTPEYMGAEQGGELASVASSTLSSQLQNIIGSLTDKLSVAPSFKSEKSDLSDMEVDVALSSSLFDNRLLINGNLGYRDKSTSQTTFIGDFDLEYLLSRDGRLRLKAYNHFNDASYYLKSALTTQGIGLIYRKDFDDPFKFIRRIFRRKKSLMTLPTDSLNNL